MVPHFAQIKAEDILPTYKATLLPLRFLFLLPIPLFPVLQHTGHLVVPQTHKRMGLFTGVPSAQNTPHPPTFTRLTSWTHLNVTFSEVTMTPHLKCKPHYTYTYQFPVTL